MSSNSDFANHSSCHHYVRHCHASPLSTSLPASGSSCTKPSDLTDPLLQGNTSSASSAPLTPVDTGNSSTVLTGSTLDPTLPIAPATPDSLPQLPQVDAIAQTLDPGTYDVTVSANPSPTPSPLPDPSLPVTATPPTSLPEVSLPIAATPPAPSPALAPIPEFVQRVLDLTNQYRAANGVAPLQLNLELNAAALNHSQDMALQDYFDHTGSDGSTSVSRMNQVGYSSLTSGENIAAGYTTPEEVVQGWIESDGHRANLLSSSFTEVGIGYYYLANDTGMNNYYSYWTQDFGSGDLNPATYV